MCILAHCCHSVVLALYNKYRYLTLFFLQTDSLGFMLVYPQKCLFVTRYCSYIKSMATLAHHNTYNSQPCLQPVQKTDPCDIVALKIT